VISKLIFISWAPNCSRSDSIAVRLGGKSYMVYSPFWGSRYATVLFKYLVQAMRTAWILCRERPQVVFVMAPPVFACFPVWLYCVLTGARYVIDAHTGAFFNPLWTRVQFLQRFFSRKAVTTIVTNEHLQQLVADWGTDATIVQDVPVCFPEAKEADLPERWNITVVCSFCDDEPIEEILSAAGHLPEIQFHMTGNASRLSTSQRNAFPQNVRLTGFVDDCEYVGLLKGSDAVLALTTRDHTMQRAAYEAIYLGIPVVTSDFAVLREAFPKGAVHVRPREKEIADGIRAMLAQLERYRGEAMEMRSQKWKRWEEVEVGLRERLELVEEQPKGSVLVNGHRFS
jgi:glycosyltransferase involved in cell wall biosynthesis